MLSLKHTNNPFIGIYDSGLGGLSVLQVIRTLLPQEDLLYYADSLYAPYGDRDSEWITDRVVEVIGQMVSEGAKAIVIACNTATVVAVESVRARFNLPIIAIEPGIKVAAERADTKTIGVIATTATLASVRYRTLVSRYARDKEVISQPCPGLVEYIERNDTHSDKFQLLLGQYLLPLRRKGIDQLVLGCTHYAFIRTQIADTLRSDIALEKKPVKRKEIDIVDPVYAVAQQLRRQLQLRKIERQAGADIAGKNYFWTTGSLDIARQFLRQSLSIHCHFHCSRVSETV